MVLTVGVDVHKDTHTAVVADELGRELGKRTVAATDAGHRALVGWAARHAAGERTWAVEDCRHVSVRLERALLGAGEQVVRVPPKLMAGTRSSARTRGKSDPIDALAIARAALREPDLPIAEHDQSSRELSSGRSPRGPRRRTHPDAERAALAPPRARPRDRSAGTEPGSASPARGARGAAGRAAQRAGGPAGR